MKRERKKSLNMPPGTAHKVGDKNAKSDPSDVKFELESKSKHIQKIKEDVIVHGDMIKALAGEIRGWSGTTEPLLLFVREMESKLVVLSDENQILKYFQWPQAKMEALRESSALVEDLQKMGKTLSSWKEKDDAECLDKYQAIDLIARCHADLDKVAPKVERMMCEARAMQDKFAKFKIDLRVDALISEVKNASLSLALAAMRAALRHLSEDKAHMLKTFKFAFRVHQFSGDGLQGTACDLFREIHLQLQTLAQ